MMVVVVVVVVVVLNTFCGLHPVLHVIKMDAQKVMPQIFFSVNIYS
jgi:fumarate reductase subunit D